MSGGEDEMAFIVAIVGAMVLITVVVLVYCIIGYPQRVSVYVKGSD